MHTIRTVLTVTTLATLTACSNAPSDSDIKKAVRSSFVKDTCEQIVFKDIKKINGMKMDENTHRIKADFTMVVEKDSAYVKNYDAYKEAERPVISTNEVAEELTALEKQRDELSVLRDQAYGYTMDNRTEGDGQSARAKVEEIDKKLEENRNQRYKVQEELKNKIEPYQKKMYEYKSSMIAQRNAIYEQCVDNRKKAFDIIKLLGMHLKDPEDSALLRGRTASYSYEFTMTKTDNGWVAQF